ncbi:MAG: 4Fe-4S double cluster binding domain-containing protein, partial [Chloroflexota bacterium]
PAHRVTFDTGRGVFEVVVPPTYAWHGKVRRQVKHELETIVLKGKYRVATLRAPLKAIAARLGLVTYGRNSLTYAPGMGSYHQLMGFLTDATVEPRPTCAARCAEISSECECCQACRSACPTGAIRADQLMLEAEKCVTLHNGSTRAWPGWIPESAHNCLVGCLICQEVCPQNEGLLRLEPAGVSFTEEETRAILSDNADHSSSAWGAIKTKLNAAGMVYLEAVMGRNLKALMAQEGSSGF